MVMVVLVTVEKEQERVGKCTANEIKIEKFYPHDEYASCLDVMRG